MQAVQYLCPQPGFISGSDRVPEQTAHWNSSAIILLSNREEEVNILCSCASLLSKSRVMFDALT